MVNRTGSQRDKGDVVMVDESASDPDVTNTIIGDENSTEANVVPTFTDFLGYARFGVCGDASVGNDDDGVFIFRGRIMVSVNSTGALTDIVSGDPLIVATGSTSLVHSDEAAGQEKVVGIAKGSSSNDIDIIEVDFDGLSGWGNA